jgi:hypothetical protein
MQAHFAGSLRSGQQAVTAIASRGIRRSRADVYRDRRGGSMDPTYVAGCGRMSPALHEMRLGLRRAAYGDPDALALYGATEATEGYN